MRDPTVIQPFDNDLFSDIQNHVREVRRLFDWPGIPYHDAHHPENDKFNRWFWHNPPMIKAIHQTDRRLMDMVGEHCGKQVRPSYAFLSMYSDEGVCPAHTDRPQCEATIDLLVNTYGGEPWPIYIADKPYALKEGQAVMYSGTGQKHFRLPMKETGSKKCDLLFLHYTDAKFMGSLD